MIFQSMIFLDTTKKTHQTNQAATAASLDLQIASVGLRLWSQTFYPHADLKNF